MYDSATKFIRLGWQSAVVRNAASLYLIQFANYVVPLVMIPYLVRVLGPTGYGTVAFAQGFINYLMLFVEYGFNWSATRRISVLREHKEQVNHIALHVWAAKGLLSVVGVSLLALLVGFVPKLREVSLLLWALYGLILGNALFPTWLFQGMERMVAISVISLGMKLGIMVGVFLLVKRPEDALVYAALMGGGTVLAGLAGTVVAFRMFGLQLIWVSWQGVWEELRDGWVLFLSKASVSLYTTGNAFILGMLTNHTVVGYYSAAERIAKATVGLLEPVAQAAYPAMAKKAAQSKERALYWARRGLFLQGALGFMISLGLCLGASFIVANLFGDKFADSISILKVLSLLPLLIAIGSSIGRFVLLPFQLDKQRLIIFTLSGIINIILGASLSLTWGGRGMAIAVVTVEFIVTVGFLCVAHKEGLNPLIMNVNKDANQRVLL